MPILLQSELDTGIKESEAPTRQSVGDGEYEVREGDCIESIAYRSGHFWKTIWDDRGNAAIKSARKDPNILLPGDRVHVPPIQPGEASCVTDKRHRFVRRGLPCILRVRIWGGHLPRANEHFILTVDGRVTTGTTSADGEVSAPILPGARNGTLVVGRGLYAQTFQLQLGGMDPIDTDAGLTKRLQNLGYCGSASNCKPEEIAAALAMFQKNHGIQATGVLNDATRDKLQQDHGS